MAFYFAAAFEDVSQAESGLGPVRELAYSFMILGVIVLFSMLGQAVCIELAAYEMTTAFKMAWFRALLRQDVAYFDVLDVAGEGTIITTNANKFKKGMGTKLTHLLQFSITFFGGLGYAFWADWRTSLAVLAVVSLISLSAVFTLKMNTSVTARANATYAKAGGIVSASVINIRTVLSLNAVDIMIDRFKNATKESFDGVVGQVAWLGLANGSNMASMLASYVIVVLYGSYLIYDQVRDDGCDPSGAVLENDKCDPAGVDVFGALMGITFSATVLPQISSAIEALYGARVACYPAMMVIRRTTTSKTSQQQVVTGRQGAVLPPYQIDSSSNTGKKPESVSGTLEFQNVSFLYPTRPNVMALSDFSLKIDPGQTVALVGFSGSVRSIAVVYLHSSHPCCNKRRVNPRRCS
jgi:ATP-binding cassette, subfamily B (MDR/TAP), member 1